ncbi:uncharacterized protein [Phaseolus vulgaris]|uniref:uncharacterized protein n=1 Tax=Phaseolus vulgaris TaxID=3885 RepID=UPI0035C9622D
MAATQAPSNEQVYKVPLKVLVDRSENKVVFAEASKDFVDVLLSFLALPLGTIARLVAKESNIPPVKLGSLSSLYESVSNLEEEHLWTPTCKEMLLHPRSSMESYYQHLKLNIDDTDPTNYFLIVYPENITLENGFVKETATFIICDDLSVLPNILVTSLNLLQKLGIKDMDAIEEQTVDISKREVVDLLKLSLISKSPLTDFIFEKKPRVYDLNPTNESWFVRGEESSDESRRIVVRALILKEELANPKCAPQFAISGQILPIGVECSIGDFRWKFSTGVLRFRKGFAKGPSTFMVTDDLLVTPMSSISAVSYLRSHVPLSDLEERAISVCVKEGLAILKASLTSTSALSKVLQQFTKITVLENW